MLHRMEQAIAGNVRENKSTPLNFANVSRRGFLAGSSAAFAIAAFAGEANAFARYKTGGDFMPRGLKYDPHIFVSIDPDLSLIHI